MFMGMSWIILEAISTNGYPEHESIREKKEAIVIRLISATQ